MPVQHLDIIYSASARKKFKQLNAKLRERIKRKITEFAENPFQFSGDIKRVKEIPGVLRLRIGDYRVFVEIDFALSHLLILSIKHRSEAYKKN